MEKARGVKKLIKEYFENTAPKKLGLNKKILVKKVSKLGMGTGNLNYLVIANNKKFVFRMNMDLRDKKKSRREFNALKIVEKYRIGPKARLIDESRKKFDSDFLIIDYVEGITVDKTKEYLTDKMVRKIARFVAKIHSIKITPQLDKLPKEKTNYSDKKKIIRNYLKYIRNNIKDKYFLEMINESSKKLLKNIPKDEDQVHLVITQGDFCEQNIIVQNGKYKLIDFEDLGLTDPASEITHILVDFGRPFEKKQKEIFFSEYLKIKKDNTLRGRVEVYLPLKSFAVFLWSVEHILKSRNKEMHEAYLESNDLERDFQYIKTTFKRAIRSGVISEKYKDINLGKVLEK